MIIDNLVEKYLGKSVDYDKAFGPQCVDLFRIYLEASNIPQPKNVKGAIDIWNNYYKDPVLLKYFIRIPNTPLGVPKKGDIMFYAPVKTNIYGHVDIFMQGNVLWFYTFSQNYNKPSCEVVNHNYWSPKVLGWFRFKG